MKPLEENLHDLRFDDEFLDTTSKPGSVKEKIEKLNCIKIENFLLCKSHCEKNEKIRHKLEKTLKNHVSDKGYVYPEYIYTLKKKKPLKLNNEKTNSSIEK